MSQYIYIHLSQYPRLVLLLFFFIVVNNPIIAHYYKYEHAILSTVGYALQNMF